jgi:hypothetical protein
MPSAEVAMLLQRPAGGLVGVQVWARARFRNVKRIHRVAASEAERIDLIEAVFFILSFTSA